MPDEGFSVYSDMTRQQSDIQIVGRNKTLSTMGLDTQKRGSPTFADKVQQSLQSEELKDAIDTNSLDTREDQDSGIKFGSVATTESNKNEVD